MTLTIILWLLTLIVFIAITIILGCNIIYHPNFRTNLRILITGVKLGLHTSGLQAPHPKKDIIIYKWIPTENACDEAFDRADMPAKDIIDWMEEGLPRTPEMRQKCGQNCHCRLIAVRRPQRKNPQPPI